MKVGGKTILRLLKLIILYFINILIIDLVFSVIGVCVVMHAVFGGDTVHGAKNKGVVGALAYKNCDIKK